MAPAIWRARITLPPGPEARAHILTCWKRSKSLVQPLDGCIMLLEPMLGRGLKMMIESLNVPLKVHFVILTCYFYDIVKCACSQIFGKWTFRYDHFSNQYIIQREKKTKLVSLLKVNRENNVNVIYCFISSENHVFLIFSLSLITPKLQRVCA